MRSSTLLTGMVAAAAVIALSACGQSNVSGSPVAPGANSQDNSGLGAQIHTVADLANVVGNDVTHTNTVHIALQGSTAVGNMSGNGSISFGNPVAEQMTMNAAGMQIQVLLVNNAFYMSVPQLAQETGKQWVKIDGSGSDPVSKAFNGIIQEIQQNADPTKILGNLVSSGTIDSQTHEQVNGQDATHYKITVDVNKMVQSQTDPELKQLMQQAQQAGMNNYPVDVWLDNKNLPIKISMAVPTPNPATHSTTTTTTTATFSDWGTPVSIVAPPADQVGSMPSMGN